MILLQKAVSNNRTGKSIFYLDKEDFGKHSLFKTYKGSDIEIESVKLDDYFKNYNGKIDLIKMDIQGAESLALEGMKNILNKNPNVKIYTEIDPIALRESGTTAKDYMKMLSEFGFNLFIINELTQRLEKIKRNRIPTQIYGAGVNLLCLRGLIQ